MEDLLNVVEGVLAGLIVELVTTLYNKHKHDSSKPGDGGTDTNDDTQDVD